MNKRRYGLASMVSLLLLALLLTRLAVAEATSIDSAKAADIKTLVKLMGIIDPALKFAKGQLDSRISSLHKAHPDIPDSVLAQVKRELMSFIQGQLWAPGGLVERLIPIYDEYLTHEEVRGSIEFFESPVGRKWLSIAIAMMKDAILAGEQWEREMGPEVIKKLHALLSREGYSVD